MCVFSAEPQCVYSIFKRLGAELVLGLFLNVRAEDQPEVFQEIMELCTEHWHGRSTQKKHQHLLATVCLYGQHGHLPRVTWGELGWRCKKKHILAPVAKMC